MKKIDQNLIGFDIDGVVADTAEAFLRLARERHGIDEFSVEQITELTTLSSWQEIAGLCP